MSDKLKPSKDCLENRPSSQPIFDIILKNQMNKYCMLEDIKNTFIRLT